MGAKVKILVKACRNLPIMDSYHGLTDAYVVVRFGPEFQFKTPVCRKTLNPTWNLDAFRFEVPNNDYLQENVIEFRVIDYDVVTQDDVIGTVIVDTNTIALNQVTQCSGWFPIFDSIRGVCGELNVNIKIDYIHNINPYRDSSPEVQFFSCPSIFPLMEYTQYSLRIGDIVEELLIDDDPEYDWKDLIRSSRSSNDERQLLLYKLSGRLKRRVGKKVQEATDNIVLGYEESFDLEDDNIIVRGLGTRCKLAPNLSLPSPHILGGTQTTGGTFSVNENLGMSITPPMNIIPLLDFHPSPTGVNQLNMDSPTSASAMVPPTSDVKILTVKTFDSHHIKYMAGIVQARSVKLVTTETMKLSDMQKERDSWWNELRAEIRENAKSLGCTHVLGYSEHYEIFLRGSVCILCAEGTAAILNPQYDLCNIRNLADAEHDQEHVDKDEDCCSMFHLPRNSPFYRAGASRCPNGDGFVPNMFMSTCEMPSVIEQRVSQQPKHFIEARICRSKKKKFGESNANAISNILPFVVHDLHKQFVHKLKLCHCNTAFSVTYGLTINDNYIIMTCKGTGLYLDALPRNAKMDFILPDEKDSTEQLRLLQEYSEYYATELDLSLEEELDHSATTSEEKFDSPRPKYIPDNLSDTSSDQPDEVLGDTANAGFALEMEDEQDEDFINSLMEPFLPCGLEFSTLKHQSELASKSMSHLQFIFLEQSFPINKSTHNEKQQQQYIASLFRELYLTLSFKLLLFANEDLCQKVHIMGLTDKIRFNNANEFTITLQAMPVLVSGTCKANASLEQLKSNLPQLYPPFPYPHNIDSQPLISPRGKKEPVSTTISPRNKTDKIFEQHNDMLFNMDIDHKDDTSSIDLASQEQEMEHDRIWLQEDYVVTSPMYFIPGTTIDNVVGKVAQHLVRESNNVNDFCSFQQECIMEATAIIKAHTRAIECNALLNYMVKFHAVVDNPSKKQAYIMLTVSGDACKVSFSPNSSKGIQRLVDLSCTK